MNKKTPLLATREDLLVDLTLHKVPASLLNEFAQKIVQPYHGGNLHVAIKHLIRQAIAEENLVRSHVKN